MSKVSKAAPVPAPGANDAKRNLFKKSAAAQPETECSNASNASNASVASTASVASGTEEVFEGAGAGRSRVDSQYRRPAPCCDVRTLVVALILWLPFVVHALVVWGSTRVGPANGLLMALLVMILGVPLLVYGLLWYCWVYTSLHIRMEIVLIVVATLMFLAPSTAVTASFVPFYNQLDDESNIWKGSVDSPVLAASTSDFLRFTSPGLVVDHAHGGAARKKIRTKSGYYYVYTFAAPLRQDQGQIGSPSIPVWVCGCGTAYGCRNFPAIAVQKGPSRDSWVMPLSTAVRVRSRIWKGECEKAARSSVINQLNGTNIWPPFAGGAVYVELSNFADLKHRIRIIVVTVLVILDLAAAGVTFFFFGVVTADWNAILFDGTPPKLPEEVTIDDIRSRSALSDDHSAVDLSGDEGKSSVASGATDASMVSSC